VLFLDFDGTLVESQKVIYEAVYHIFDREDIQPPSFEEYYVGLRHPFLDFYRSRGVKAHEDDIGSVFDRFMANHTYDFFSDTLPFLQSTFFRGYTVVVISGNTIETIERVFQKHTVTPYVRKIVGRAYDKETVFRKTMDSLRVSPKQVVAVGDSISDVEGARASGIERAYGILRGPARTSKIQQVMKDSGAHAVIGSLHEVWNYERIPMILS
jgi:phosphoglycolate phosphatase-like HAD superfamily hydrolase